MKAWWQNTDPTAKLLDAKNALFPRHVNFESAQNEVNFEVFRPNQLPWDCAIIETTLRPEQPPGRPEGITVEQLGQTPWSVANPCSLRTTIKGANRQLRIKQFLYDWAPPAASIAPLWDSARVRPSMCDGTVAWTGIDYRSAKGACVQLHRTQVEISVVEGEFSEEELQTVIQGMRAVSNTAADLVRAAPFHELNYWLRYKQPPYRVPYGLWQYPHKRRYDCSQSLSYGDLVTLKRPRVLLPIFDEFALDSVALLEDQSAPHLEVEMVLRRKNCEHDSLYLVAMIGSSPHAISIPPKANERSCELLERRELRNTSIYLGALTKKYGAWEALWSERGHCYAIWTSASLYWDESKLLNFIKQLAPLA